MSLSAVLDEERKGGAAVKVFEISCSVRFKACIAFNVLLWKTTYRA